MMFKDIQSISLEELKKRCAMIHYFGLGFIQIKLGKYERIHFYTETLPPIINEEDIHNHRYDFTSHILYGTLEQETFIRKEGEGYTCSEESCKEGEPVNHKDEPCDIQFVKKEIFNRGDSYNIHHQTFHRVMATEAITHITRSDYKKENAQVIQKYPREKICPFSKKIDEAVLWKIVEQMLDKAKNK